MLLPTVVGSLSLHDALPISVGMTTIGDHACFGLYADATTLPESDALARDLDAALDELGATTETPWPTPPRNGSDRKSTRLNSSHTVTSYAVFCLKKKRG